MRRVSVTLAAAAALLLALPALAAAAGGAPEQARAERALERVQDLKRGIGVRTGRELTHALAELARQREALGARARRTADALLARPTDGGSDPQGDGYTVAEETPVCGDEFCVHYVDTTADAPPLTDTTPANGIPDYVETMLAVFDDEVFPCENGSSAIACSGSPGMGWPAPPSDGTRGGDDRVDVYLKQLGNQSIFGYVATDPQPGSSSMFSYVVMDDDYSLAEFPGYASFDVPLRVTAAHEYNHVIQNGIEAFQDVWMFESTATWSEEKVYPALNDYLNYLTAWKNSTLEPLTDKNAGGGLKIYGSAVWNHFIAGRHGDDTILDAWQDQTDVGVNGGPFAPASYGSAIVANGGAGFAQEFGAFAAAVAEWRAPGSGFPDNALYPDVPRGTSLTVGGGATTIQLDHTAFTLRDVTPPAAPAALTLQATLPAGLKGAIALVGRTGNSQTAGTVTKQVTHVASGGAASVTLPNADTYGRITAVLVNADPSQSGWNNGQDDWAFTRDNENFTGVQVTAGAPPVAPEPVTTAASSVTQTGAKLNGTVDPNGSATTYWFEYGTTTAYGTQVPVVPASAGSGTEPVAQSAAITGLTRGTTYHFRIVAQNGGGIVNGSDQTFTTLDPPIVSTDPATGIGVDAATLEATVDPRGRATTYVFEYGTTTAYGSQVPLAPDSAGSGTAPVPVEAALTGLTRGNTYHYRVVATNADGSTAGFDRSFTTLDPPVVSTGGAGSISSSGATVTGSVDPRGKQTNWFFEYGTSTAYGSQTATQDAGATTGAVSTAAQLTGLPAGTTVHYRLVATNADGTTVGGDRTFVTAVAGGGTTSGGTAGTTGTTTGTTPGTTTTGGETAGGAITQPAFAPTLAVIRATLRTALRRGLRARVGCGRACTVVARAKVSRTLARRLRLRSVTVAIGRAAPASAATSALTLRFNRAARRALGRTRSVRLTLTLIATDGTGQRRTLVRRITLRR